MMLNLERSKKYILACSFGPDSMALFDLLLDECYKFVVCNINYNHRDISTKETEELEAYCKLKNIPFYTKSVHFPGKNLNFESWARKIRYDFFFQIGKQLNINDILIAHNEDDHLETYLMQKERDGIVNYYGLKASSKMQGFNIERPILHFSKANLEYYCKSRNIPFSIDVSNFDTKYRRNYFRHDVIAKMTEQERHNLVVEITNKNLDLELQGLKLKKYIFNNSVKKDALIKLDKNDAYFIITNLVNNDEFHGEISKKLVDDLLFAINKNAKSWSYKFKDNFVLKLNYNLVTLINLNADYLEEIDYKDYLSEHFKINTNSSNFNLLKDANKLFIKPCKHSDYYVYKGIKKSINRCFIDWKMPHDIRQIWPGIYDENNNLLYIPRYKEIPTINEKSLLIFEIDKIL